MADLVYNRGAIVRVPFDAPSAKKRKQAIRKAGEILKSIEPRTRDGREIRDYLASADQISGDNLQRLAEHYGVDKLERLSKWKALAMILAQGHYPNCFYVQNGFPQGRRKASNKLEREALLKSEFDRLIARGKSEQSAAEWISKNVTEWQGRKPKYLCNVFRKIKKTAP